jgi:hypothetical protein
MTIHSIFLVPRRCITSRALEEYSFVHPYSTDQQKVFVCKSKTCPFILYSDSHSQWHWSSEAFSCRQLKYCLFNQSLYVFLGLKFVSIGYPGFSSLNSKLQTDKFDSFFHGKLSSQLLTGLSS